MCARQKHDQLTDFVQSAQRTSQRMERSLVDTRASRTKCRSCRVERRRSMIGGKTSHNVISLTAVLKAYVFLASDASSYMTGECSVSELQGLGAELTVHRSQHHHRWRIHTAISSLAFNQCDLPYRYLQFMLCQHYHIYASTAQSTSQLSPLPLPSVS